MKKIAAVFVVLLMAGCASAPTTNTSPISATTTSTSANTSPDTTAALSAAEVESRKLAAEKSAMQALQKLSVYFDFDQYEIKAADQGILQQQAEFLKSHVTDVVTLDGNADERGSNEYNLALGDRRASAVQKNLKLMGVSEEQIKTKSLGAEKPRLLCHEEKCWQENRRVDFMYKANN
jgi:peptidoglycan-associated lipoprotein